MIEITLVGRGPNTMSLAMLDRVDAEIASAGEQPILVTGAGDAFSAGLDLDELAKADADYVVRLLESMERVVRRLFLHPAPTAALVNGHAVAGGCLLVQCCDVRICVDNPSVRLGMTGVAIGLTYPPFVPEVFGHRVPPPHLETVLLGAQLHAPERARELGLLDDVVSKDVARGIAESHVAARNRLPLRSYAATKRALREPAFARSAEDQRRFTEEVLPAWTGALIRRPPRQ